MTDILDHLQPDSPLYEATRDAAREEITRLRAYVERLEKRLEIDAVWQCGADGNMTLVEIPKSERVNEPCDGIFCRDETIKLQDEAITNLRSLNKELAEALEPFAAMAAGFPDDAVICRIRVSDDFDFSVYGRHMHAAYATLTKYRGKE